MGNDGLLPSYVALLEQEELERRAQEARSRYSCCTVCPRQCKANRSGGEKGVCKVLDCPIVSSAFAHFGEESVLVGRHGSGTIFFSECNLRCVFCQNFEISHGGEGREVSDEVLAEIMVKLQDEGCHNINLVTPSHVVPNILGALSIARRQGLRLPIVYNTSAYDSLDTLRLLDRVVDIYMPDFKFASRELSKRFLKTEDYPDVAFQAIEEMHRQVGDLKISEDGIAQKGVLVRHLVMPSHLDDTKEVLKLIASISIHTYINIMAQFRPLGYASRYPEINRRITREEILLAYEEARRLGLYRFAD
jgi:putative pyruvate formate lyase activating enzyme